MDNTTENSRVSSIPPYLLQPPAIVNLGNTPTSEQQAATVAECLPFLNGLNSPSVPFDPFSYLPNGMLMLQKDEHASFLHDALSEYPAPYVMIDAARPWMLYWTLTALHFLDEDLAIYRDRLVKTLFPLQNKTGGYGGGQGHLSHLAPTYAAILSLALVGGEDAWAVTDRKAIWEWLGRLKQADGGFAICEGGEEDARGAYCALVIMSLLNLPWDLPSDSPGREQGLLTFGDGLGDWLRRCQTYEGGVAAAPGSEAHGAYAFCAVACLCLLDRPDRSLKQWLNIGDLIQWLSSRQYSPEGGLAGRTNKVVDGCYSQWLGGIWPLVQAALAGPCDDGQDPNDLIYNLYSTEGLARYILNCCQNPSGGLRDKPSKGPDTYHTCYTLAGLSLTEHCHYYTNSHEMRERFSWVFDWKVKRVRSPENDKQAENYSEQPNLRSNWNLNSEFDPTCDLNAVHPVFVTPHQAVANMRRWALQQPKLL